GVFAQIPFIHRHPANRRLSPDVATETKEVVVFGWNQLRLFGCINQCLQFNRDTKIWIGLVPVALIEGIIVFVKSSNPDEVGIVWEDTFKNLFTICALLVTNTVAVEP